MKKAVVHIGKGLSNSGTLLKRAYHYTSNRPLTVFLKAICSDPQSMGACCPSSRRLAAAMAQEVPIPAAGKKILELGGGTGAITEALLRRGIDASQLIVVECDKKLAAYLQKRFPGVSVINGDAAHLEQILGEDFNNIDTVVSSLPLLSLPKHVVHAIEKQLAKLLAGGKRYIQFTYNLRMNEFKLRLNFERVRRKFVWYNIPPARVDVCQLKI